MYRHIVFEHRQKLPDGDLIEIRLWEVEPSEEHPEGIRYSLIYVRNNKRLIGYDNYHGKGHHRHIHDREEAYEFAGKWKVIECSHSAGVLTIGSYISFIPQSKARLMRATRARRASMPPISNRGWSRAFDDFMADAEKIKRVS